MLHNNENASNIQHPMPNAEIEADKAENIVKKELSFDELFGQINVEMREKQEAISKFKSKYEASVYELDERVHWLKAFHVRLKEEILGHKKRLNVYFKEIKH